jgi:uncharacterized protein YegL
MSLRRLPVYVLADCSGSMTGAPIESVKSGIRELHNELMGDPQTIESAYLSVITFNSDAEQLVPLTELPMFSPPDLVASGTTSLGAALKLLVNRIENEVNETTEEQKGDWKPLVFLLTDGAPTDDWESAADVVRRNVSCNVICVACGEGAEPEVLKRVSETVMVMRDMTPDSFKQFFKWVSASIKQTSAKAGTVEEDVGVELPPVPPVITIHP